MDKINDKMLEDSAEMRKMRAKRIPRWPQEGPRRPLEGPRWPQEGPRWPQEGPKRAQDDAKMAQDRARYGDLRLRRPNVKNLQKLKENAGFGRVQGHRRGSK